MIKFLNVFNWIAAIVLCFIYSVLITSLLFFLMTMKIYPELFPIENWGWILIIGIALFLVLIFVWGGFNLFLKKFNLDRKKYFRFKY